MFKQISTFLKNTSASITDDGQGEKFVLELSNNPTCQTRSVRATDCTLNRIPNHCSMKVILFLALISCAFAAKKAALPLV